MIDIKTLDKMIEIANTGNYTELDKEYFDDITHQEAINRFRFILAYNDIRFQEIKLMPKNNEDDHNTVGFIISMKDSKLIKLDRLAHYSIHITAELKDNVCVIFEEPIQTDQEQFLEHLRQLSGDNDEVNNMIKSYKLFKGTHQYDVHAVLFNNDKLEKINETYLN